MKSAILIALAVTANPIGTAGAAAQVSIDTSALKVVAPNAYWDLSA